jgi:uncharacterized protein
MPMLLIVGASARAAAASALRAGFTPWCADLFADADLRAMVPDAVRCPLGQYPKGLESILQNAPDGPWIYTGGLENHPNLIRRMARLRPVWGNGPDALSKCRSPFAVERILRDAGLPALEVRAAGASLHDYCRWLRKPLKGSAGIGITFGEPPGRKIQDSAAGRRQNYYQRFVEGTPMSAVFVRARGGVQLLGVTEQLVGTDWLDAPPFRYAGNIGPVELHADTRHELLRIGIAIGEGCGLLGLFGVDFVLHDGRPWVVEVNPRYTASIEVLERATGVSALSLHRGAFESEVKQPAPTAPAAAWAGKAIVYATKRVVIPPYDSENGNSPSTGAFRTADPLDPVSYADIPHPGDVIDAGWPILTTMANGDTRSQCLARLVERACRAKFTVYRDVGDKSRKGASERIGAEVT